MEKDIGIDLNVELLDGSVPNGLYFNAQCKGKDEIEIDEEHIKISIKITTINYWLLRKEPTFLFVVDPDNLNIFWCYPFDQLSDRLSELQRQATVIIKIDKQSRFTFGIQELPLEIERIIRDFDHNLFENLSQSISNTVFESASRQQGSLKDKLMAFKDSAELLKSNYQAIIDHQRDQFILDQTRVILEKFRFVLSWLDAESPLIFPYTHGKYIYEADGFIEGSTIDCFIKDVNLSIDNYESNASPDNFDILVSNLEELNNLNRNLAFFLREILYEMNPYGEFDYLTQDY
ncbi:DUF4365 domain-containing protein [Paenibacillus xylanivorans]|uniref:DUF4365 domain-containing protein n=1 Tax=Paenibacillus xylanivorans TaxID=1705561 RepID=UPI000AB30B6B|nr:DUF4365 domain-containing protein [Paenibacillus xylanivorans]